MLGPIESVKYVLYGYFHKPESRYFDNVEGWKNRPSRSITQDFTTEEEAVVRLLQHAVSCRNGEVICAVVAKVTKHRVIHDLLDYASRSPARSKDVPEVVMRIGEGTGWWERPR